MSKIITNKSLLSRKSKTVPVEWFNTGEAKSLEAELIETRKEAAQQNNRLPLALSAIQIDKPYQMCIVSTFFKHRTKTIVNPVILERMGIQFMNFETCLSFPGQCFMATRYNKIKVRYLDIKGRLKEKVFRGLIARQIQHEVEHMNGIIPSNQQFEAGNNYAKNRRK